MEEVYIDCSNLVAILARKPPATTRHLSWADPMSVKRGEMRELKKLYTVASRSRELSMLRGVLRQQCSTKGAIPTTKTSKTFPLAFVFIVARIADE